MAGAGAKGSSRDIILAGLLLWCVVYPGRIGGNRVPADVPSASSGGVTVATNECSVVISVKGEDARGCIELSDRSRWAIGGRATRDEGPGDEPAASGRRASNVEDIGGVGGACLVVAAGHCWWCGR